MIEEEQETLDTNKPVKNKAFKAILYRKIFIALFLFNLFIDQYWIVKFLAYTFELEIERKAYIAISYLFFILIFSSYLKLIFERSKQTNIETLKKNEPKRIFLFDENDFSKKCLFCSGASKHKRSSHCSACQICILKRDHHCPWIDNCVGHGNLSVFWIYMFWLIIYGIHYSIGFNNFYNNKLNILDKVSILSRLCVLITSITTSFAFLGVCYMMGNKFFEYLNGATYYEEQKDGELEKYYTCCVTKIKNCRHYNAYNKGWLCNMESIYGPTLLHFFLPLPKMTKNDIIEQESCFIPNAQVSTFARIKALNNNKTDILENLLANQYEQSSPTTFMDYARNNYNCNTIKII